MGSKWDVLLNLIITILPRFLAISFGIVLLLLLYIALKGNVISWCKKQTVSFIKLFDKKKLKVCFTASAFFMLVCYAYLWLNQTFIFDACNFYAKPSFGSLGINDKIFPVYNILLDGHTLPWIDGLFSIVCFAMAIYFIAEVLEVERTFSIWLITGLCSVCTGTLGAVQFPGGSFAFQASLLFACFAAWINNQKSLHPIVVTIWTAVFVCLSLGTYGAYASMTCTLMIFTLFFDLFEKRKTTKGLWINAFLYAFRFIFGAVLFYGIYRLIRLCNTNLAGVVIEYLDEDKLQNTSSTVSNTLLWIPDAYESIIKYYFTGNNFVPSAIKGILSALFVLGVFMSVYLMWKNRKRIDNASKIIYLVVLVFIIPLSLNLIEPLASGNLSARLTFTYVAPFLLFVKEMELLTDIESVNIQKDIAKCFKSLYMLTSVVFIFGGILVANALSVKYVMTAEDMQAKANRLLSKIEDVDGFTGNEDIVMIQIAEDNEYLNSTRFWDDPLLDANLDFMNSNLDRDKPIIDQVDYITKVYQSTLVFEWFSDINECVEKNNMNQDMAELLQSMKQYPYDESIRKINDTIYITY